MDSHPLQVGGREEARVFHSLELLQTRDALSDKSQACHCSLENVEQDLRPDACLGQVCLGGFVVVVCVLTLTLFFGKDRKAKLGHVSQTERERGGRPFPEAPSLCRVQPVRTCDR